MSQTGVLSVFSPLAARSSTSWSPGAAAVVTGRGAVVVESAAALASASAVTIRRIMGVFNAAMRLCAALHPTRRRASGGRWPRRRNGAKATPSGRGVVPAVLARVAAPPLAWTGSTPVLCCVQQRLKLQQPSAEGARSAARLRIDSSSGSRGLACLKRQRASRLGSHRQSLLSGSPKSPRKPPVSRQKGQ